MRAMPFIKFVGSLLIAALATTLPVTVHAGGAAGAQVALVGVNGSLTSGSTDFGYFLNLNVTSPGTLTVTATVKGKSTVDGSKWKAEFPLLTSMPPVGFSTVNSGVISIPANFRGDATLKIKAKYGKKTISNQKILVAINAPVVVPPAPLTTLYDVGFNANTNLDASVFSTAGLTGPFTYAWSITDTDVRSTATLSNATSAVATLKTLPISTFPINLDFIVAQEAATMKVGIDTDAMNQSTYHVRCIITDSLMNSVTGNVTVISSSVSPAQQSIPLGERQYFSRGVTTNGYSWSLVGKPVGSATVLENATTRNPSIVPDKEGEYTIRDARSGEQFTVKGATFVGTATCAECHGNSPQVGLRNMVTPWSQTGHATFFSRAVDGLVSDHYGENCVSCHTVGYNKAPRAVNGGFDDVQWETGWMFPSLLQLGNYALVPDALKSVSNIGCESCHGPGSQHPGPASTTLDVAACATCHQDGHYHTRVEQWERSPHSEPFFLVSEEEGTNPSCAKCHSTAGFIDNSRGLSPVRTEANMLSCQGCHDPHNEKGYPAQVRFYDSVTLDDSVNTANPPSITGAGTSATCMFCHNSRRSMPPTHDPRTTAPHESTATDVLLGIRPSTNVTVVVDGATNVIATVKLENSAHTGVAKCTDCHMYPNPGIGQPGHNLMGDHTFSVRNVDTGEGNLASCQQCHAGVDDVSDLDHISVISANLPNGGDYDGNGIVEGVQTEVAGVKAHLEAKLNETGVTVFGRLANYNTPNSPTNLVRAVQRNAVWNHWLIEREGSLGVHNTAFAVRLLQWSYTVLSTNTGGNAYSTDFPNADLR